jgi:hypothetical protein
VLDTLDTGAPAAAMGRRFHNEGSDAVEVLRLPLPFTTLPFTVRSGSGFQLLRHAIAGTATAWKHARDHKVTDWNRAGRQSVQQQRRSLTRSSADSPAASLTACLVSPCGMIVSTTGHSTVCDCCRILAFRYNVDAWGSWAEGIRQAGLRKGQQVAFFSWSFCANPTWTSGLSGTGSPGHVPLPSADQ